MPNQKVVLRAIAAGLAASISLAVAPLSAETTPDSDRLEKLERAVDQLQKRNAELEKEVSALKKQAMTRRLPSSNFSVISGCVTPTRADKPTTILRWPVQRTA